MIVNKRLQCQSLVHSFLALQGFKSSEYTFILMIESLVDITLVAYYTTLSDVE